MKKIVFGLILLTALLLVFGCTTFDIPTNGGSNIPGVSGNGAAECPSSLQACGDGCIPTNAICCDNGTVNGYCLQPSTGCGNGTCNSCPEGQVLCGMLCKAKGEKCCIGNCSTDNTTVSGESTAHCPSTGFLQECGGGCISINAICCNSGSLNGYCLKPSTGCGDGTCNTCPVGQVLCGMLCTDKETYCSPAILRDSIGSSYAGTYTGTFNYEYQDSDCEKALSQWTPASFTLTLTFKTRFQSDWTDPNPYFNLNVTNAISSEPGFATGSGGVSLLAGPYSMPEGIVDLPFDPAKQDGENSSLTLIFPNNSKIETQQGAEGSPSPIKISADGKTLSNNPDWVNPYPESPTYTSWKANTTEAGSVLWDRTPALEYATGGTPFSDACLIRSYNFGSWSITKVSD